MFSRLFNVRLKTAEKALGEGRLDEAFRAAISPDICAHSRGEVIRGKLAHRFVERARRHFADERFTEALHDLTKAEQCGARAETVNELRKHIRTVADEVARRKQSQHRLVEEARERIQHGSLAAGARILDEADPHHKEAKRLAGDIEDRQRRVTEGVENIHKLLKDNQLQSAAAALKKIKALDPRSDAVLKLEATVCEKIATVARSTFESGRINRAMDELAALGSIGRTSADRRDVEELLELAKNASRALGRDDFEEAHRNVLRLQRLAPKVRWVNEAAKQLDQLGSLMTGLFGGPLGEHAKSFAVADGDDQRQPAKPIAETMLAKHRALSPEALPEKLVMLVDGGGSYLIVRKNRMTIGRATTANPADMPLHSDLAERHAEIARVEDEYFLFSGRDVEVGGRPTRHHLLRDGDRVVLARNVKFSFRRPHRQSQSGILELSGSTKMPGDVRRVVLFDRTAMIGFDSTAHITCQSADRSLLLFERAGRLWVKPLRRNGVDSEAVPVVMGEQIELANVSFTVRAFEAATPKRSF